MTVLAYLDIGSSAGVFSMFVTARRENYDINDTASLRHGGGISFTTINSHPLSKRQLESFFLSPSVSPLSISLLLVLRLMYSLFSSCFRSFRIFPNILGTFPLRSVSCTL